MTADQVQPAIPAMDQEPARQLGSIHYAAVTARAATLHIPAELAEIKQGFEAVVG